MTLISRDVRFPKAWEAGLSEGLDLTVDAAGRIVSERSDAGPPLAGLSLGEALLGFGIEPTLAARVSELAADSAALELTVTDPVAGLRVILSSRSAAGASLRIEADEPSCRPPARQPASARIGTGPTVESILDTVPVSVFWKSADGRYAGSNARFWRACGFASVAELRGRTDAEMPWGAIAAELRAEDQRVLRGDIDKVETERVIHRDGYEDICLAITKAPLWDDAGEISGVLGFCYDVTGRHQHERELERIANAFTSDGESSQLQALVRAAAQIGGTRFAMISEVDADGQFATIEAFFPPDRALVGARYALAGTPCELVFGGDACHFSEAVADDFPDDPMLEEMGIEAYFGRRLLRPDGRPAAIFALMHDDALEGRADLGTVLDIFASRALVEIERERTLTELKATQARLSAALQSGAVGIWEWDPVSDRMTTEGLDGAFHQTGPAPRLTTAELFGRVGAANAETIKEALRAYRHGDAPLIEFEIRVLGSDGAPHDLSVRGHCPEGPSTGEPRTLVGTMMDITALKYTQSALEEAHRFQKLVLDAVPHWVFWQDRDLHYLGCNEQFAAAAGLPERSDIVGVSASDLKFGTKARDFFDEDRRLLNGERGRLDHEIEYVDGHGRSGWLDVTKVPMRDGAGDIIGLLGTAHDVTRQKNAEQEAQRLAFFDPLTNLANRRYLIERLRTALATAVRHAQTGALLFIDMDEFKQINDSLGHSVGDALLQKIAWRLGNVTRADDTVARLGGDEFVVLLPAVADDRTHAIDHAQRVADKISQLLGQPYQVDNHVFHVTPTIGISLFPEGGKTVDDVLKEADTAMYCGKSAGRNQTKFFAADMQAEANRKIQMASDIRVALERDEFEVYYQAQVDGSSRAFGAEALVRWNRPGIGFVSPADFIPVAEARGVIGALGDWVLDQVFATVRRWIDGAVPALDHVSINVSSRQFRAGDFVDSVAHRIEDHGIPPGYIMLEITEGTVIDDVQGTIEKMKALRALGVRFAMDDFGTGYSSLGYLKALPIDQLKIDRSFISDIGCERDDEVICETVIAMGQHLGLQVIAEGVETEQQFEFLREHGCDGFQGYYFMRPGPEAEFTAFVSRR